MDLSEQPAGDFLRHPWEVARAEFFLGELIRADLVRAGLRVLDVGSGDAWFAGEVVTREPELKVTCWDLGYEERKPVPRPGLDYTSRSPEGFFDVCLMLDVAEHVEDDRAFVADVLTRLRPSGHVLFSVPAWQSLYSNHDRALRHHRRYSPRAARSLLADAGLEVLRSGGLFHSLLVPRALMKWTEGRTDEGADGPPEDLAWKGSRFVRSLVLAGLRLDRGLTKLAALSALDVPGLSWWALCRKP